jgi:hypothetical protein
LPPTVPGTKGCRCAVMGYAGAMPVAMARQAETSLITEFGLPLGLIIIDNRPWRGARTVWFMGLRRVLPHEVRPALNGLNLREHARGICRRDQGRDRKMGQGDPSGQHQAKVGHPTASQYSIRPEAAGRPPGQAYNSLAAARTPPIPLSAATKPGRF